MSRSPTSTQETRTIRCPICWDTLGLDRITHLGDETNQCWRQFCKDCFERANYAQRKAKKLNYESLTCPVCRGPLTLENWIRQFTIEFMKGSQVTNSHTIGVLAKNWFELDQVS